MGPCQNPPTRLRVLCWERSRSRFIRRPLRPCRPRHSTRPRGLPGPVRSPSLGGVAEQPGRWRFPRWSRVVGEHPEQRWPTILRRSSRLGSAGSRIGMQRRKGRAFAFRQPPQSRSGISRGMEQPCRRVIQIQGVSAGCRRQAKLGSLVRSAFLQEDFGTAPSGGRESEGAARPPACNDAPGYDRVNAVAGCNAARARLAGPERRRRTEPDYRAGWNSL